MDMEVAQRTIVHRFPELDGWLGVGRNITEKARKNAEEKRSM